MRDEQPAAADEPCGVLDPDEAGRPECGRFAGAQPAGDNTSQRTHTLIMHSYAHNTNVYFLLALLNHMRFAEVVHYPTFVSSICVIVVVNFWFKLYLL